MPAKIIANPEMICFFLTIETFLLKIKTVLIQFISNLYIKSSYLIFVKTFILSLCILCIALLTLVLSNAEGEAVGGLDVDFESHIDGKIYKRMEDGKPVVVVEKPSSVKLPIFISTFGGEQPTYIEFQVTAVESRELKLPAGITFQSEPNSVSIKENENGSMTTYLQITVNDKAKGGKYEIPLSLEWSEGHSGGGTSIPSIILNIGKDFGQDVIPENKLFLDGLSPLKQIKLGLYNFEVKCKEGLMLVAKKTDNSAACVKPLTYNKLVERGWVHVQGFEMTFYVSANDTKYEIPYHVTGWRNKVLNMTADVEVKSLVVNLQAKNKGDLTITLPRGLLDSKVPGNDDEAFFVLLNGEEVNFAEEKTKTSSTLTMKFSEGANQIEIIGTMLI